MSLIISILTAQQKGNHRIRNQSIHHQFELIILYKKSQIIIEFKMSSPLIHLHIAKKYLYKEGCKCLIIVL